MKLSSVRFEYLAIILLETSIVGELTVTNSVRRSNKTMEERSGAPKTTEKTHRPREENFPTPTVSKTTEKFKNPKQGDNLTKPTVSKTTENSNIPIPEDNLTKPTVSKTTENPISPEEDNLPTPTVSQKTTPRSKRPYKSRGTYKPRVSKTTEIPTAELLKAGYKWESLVSSYALDPNETYLTTDELDKDSSVQREVQELVDRATRDETTTERPYKTMKDHFYYFAYGSNISPEILHKYCPSAERVCIAILKDHRLDFEFWATIVPDKNKHVWGVVWYIHNNDTENLDYYEDVDEGLYRVIEVTVEKHNLYITSEEIYTNASDTMLKCRCYQLIKLSTKEEDVSPHENVNSNLTIKQLPAEWYMKDMIDSCREQSIPEIYIDELEKVNTTSNIFKEDAEDCKKPIIYTMDDLKDVHLDENLTRSIERNMNEINPNIDLSEYEITFNSSEGSDSLLTKSKSMISIESQST